MWGSQLSWIFIYSLSELNDWRVHTTSHALLKNIYMSKEHLSATQTMQKTLWTVNCTVLVGGRNVSNHQRRTLFKRKNVLLRKSKSTYLVDFFANDYRST